MITHEAVCNVCSEKMRTLTEEQLTLMGGRGTNNSFWSTVVIYRDILQFTDKIKLFSFSLQITMYSEYAVKRPPRQSNTNRNLTDTIHNLPNQSCIIKSYTFLEVHYPPISCLFFNLPLSLWDRTDGDVQACSCKPIPSSNGASANTPHIHARKPDTFHLTCTLQLLQRNIFMLLIIT